MTSLLERHNYITYEAAAQEAIELMKSQRHIQLVITDYHMPDTNGTELVVALRKTFNKERLAIIGVSSGNSSQLTARFIKSGASDFYINLLS